MKSARQAQREARALFRVCQVNGTVDEDRTRRVVRHIVEKARPGTLPLLKRLCRLVSLESRRRRVIVQSAAPLHVEVRAQLEASVARVYGPGPSPLYGVDPALLGGVRVIVGSDVFDGSIRAGLEALEARL